MDFPVCHDSGPVRIRGLRELSTAVDEAGAVQRLIAAAVHGTVDALLMDCAEVATALRGNEFVCGQGWHETGLRRLARGVLLRIHDNAVGCRVCGSDAGSRGCKRQVRESTP